LRPRIKNQKEHAPTWKTGYYYFEELLVHDEPGFFDSVRDTSRQGIFLRIEWKIIRIIMTMGMY
jgi:hypothetical protein